MYPPSCQAHAPSTSRPELDDDDDDDEDELDELEDDEELDDVEDPSVHATVQHATPAHSQRTCMFPPCFPLRVHLERHFSRRQFQELGLGEEGLAAR
jgi:hypothetical protein